MQEGELIDGYRIIRELGKGSMGLVFEVLQEREGRRAALKVLQPEFTEDAEVAQRFINEARAANLIAHPGVVQVFGHGKTFDGGAYYVMEFLAGDSLRVRLKQGGGKLGENMLNVAGQIAAAMAAAHAHQVVHRDLKPDNIVIVPDPGVAGGERVKILDFGIAKLLESDAAGVKTAAGTAMGTPTYMSPEQFTGAGEVTDRADVYSLGVILYHFVAGRPPFQARGPGDLLMMHINSVPVDLRELDPQVDERLATLIHRMLGKKPPERPAMAQVVAELVALGAQLLPADAALVAPEVLPEAEEASAPAPDGEPGEQPEGTMMMRSGRAPLRLGLILAAGAAVALLLGGGLWFALRPKAAPVAPVQQREKPAAKAPAVKVPTTPPAPAEPPVLQQAEEPPAPAVKPGKKKRRRR